MALMEVVKPLSKIYNSGTLINSRPARNSRSTRKILVEAASGYPPVVHRILSPLIKNKCLTHRNLPGKLQVFFDFIHSRYILSNPYYINQKTLPLGGLAMRQGKVSNQPTGRRLNTLRFTISVNAIPNQPISTIHKSILSRVSLRTLRTDISSKNLHSGES